MISFIISRTVIMLFGTLYPAYASYKAVRSRNVREYVKWMMYWIVFAIFNCIETFTDIFLSWFPFYYELKILLVIWLLAPATKGSSILYRKFVHPTLSNKEQEIDEYISKAKEQSYKQVLDLGTRGMSAIMQTAIKSGGGLVNQIKKSYSLGDLTDCNMEEQDGGDTMDIEPRLSRHSRSRRVVRSILSSGGSSSSTATPNTNLSKMKATMYYSQLDIHGDSLDSIPSEDLSSGYFSGDANLAASTQSLLLQQQRGVRRSEPLQRTASLTRAKPTRVTRSTGVTIVRKGSTAAAEDSSENHIETESQSSASDEDFQDTVDANAGENGPSASNVLALVNDTIVTQSPENSVLFPSFNTTPLNRNITADSAITSDIKCSSSDEPFTEFINKSEETGCTKNLYEHDMDQTKHKILELRIVDQDIMNTTNIAQNMSNIDTIRNKLEKVTSVLENIEKIEELKINADMQDEIRAGKYNKRHAPAIPERGSAITAKLVLKPGILKPLTNPEDSSVAQIFCHSPKFRRKSCGGSKSPSGSCSSLSRSRSGSKSPCRPKIDGSSGSFMKLAVLQKKLFGKDGTDKYDHCKRKSRQDGFLHGKMSDLFHPSGASEKRDNLHDNDLD